MSGKPYRERAVRVSGDDDGTVTTTLTRDRRQSLENSRCRHVAASSSEEERGIQTLGRSVGARDAAS